MPTHTRLSNLKCWYLASPYSHPDPGVVAARAHTAALATVHLLSLPGVRVNVFSPIVHSHVLHLAGMKGDWATWKDIDTDYLERFDGLIVLRLPGWENSVGVNAEIEIAKKLGLPIFALDINPKGEFSKLQIFRDE